MAVNKIEKTNWISNFTLVGKAKIGDYTFRLNESKEGSNWVRNSMTLRVDCGEESGNIRAEMQGGYDKINDNFIYAHGKKPDKTDDYENRIKVDWQDRFNTDVLENIGDSCFIKVGIETDVSGKIFYKRFLSAYDAIEYLQKYLTNDTDVVVRGNIKYTLYDNKVYMNKNITNISLYKSDSPKYGATFIQSVLVNRDSVDMTDVDKTTGYTTVNATVLDYIKEYNGVEIKGQFPYHQSFGFYFEPKNPERTKKIYERLFKSKNGYYNQINFIGKFVGNGGTVSVSVDDIPDDVKELIDMGLYTEEEALAKCAVNTSTNESMILIKPYTRNATPDSPPVVQFYPERYSDEKLMIDIPDSDGSSDNFDVSDDDVDWLNQLQ